MKRLCILVSSPPITAFVYPQICQQRLNHMLPLEAYLLKPVQRVLKYALLLGVSMTAILSLLFMHINSISCLTSFFSLIHANTNSNLSTHVHVFLVHFLLPSPILSPSQFILCRMKVVYENNMRLCFLQCLRLSGH